MSVMFVQDPFNNRKVWAVKRYSCGHYYYKEFVCGRSVSRWHRTTKKFLNALLFFA